MAERKPLVLDSNNRHAELPAGDTLPVSVLPPDLAAVEAIATTGGVERTAPNTWGTFTLTAAGKAILDDADITAQRATLGLVIGTHVQAYDATLAALAAYNTTGILVQTSADTFAGRTLTAPAAGLTITNPAGTSGNPTFALADDLAALEALGSTGIARRTGANTWTVGTTVSIAEGGTGQTSQTNAFDALSPLTTQGDTIYHDGSDNVRLPKGTAGQVLKMNAGATAPEWGAAASMTYSTQGGNFNAAVNNGYIITANAVTATLPSTGTRGDKIAFYLRGSITSFIVGRNTRNIQGVAEDMTVDMSPNSITLVFDDTTNGWWLE